MQEPDASALRLIRPDKSEFIHPAVVNVTFSIAGYRIENVSFSAASGINHPSSVRRAIERVQQLLGELRAAPAADTAMLAVALRELRNLG